MGEGDICLPVKIVVPRKKTCSAGMPKRPPSDKYGKKLQYCANQLTHHNKTQKLHFFTLFSFQSNNNYFQQEIWSPLRVIYFITHFGIDSTSFLLKIFSSFGKCPFIVFHHFRLNHFNIFIGIHHPLIREKISSS